MNEDNFHDDMSTSKWSVMQQLQNWMNRRNDQIIEKVGSILSDHSLKISLNRQDYDLLNTNFKLSTVDMKEDIQLLKQDTANTQQQLKEIIKAHKDLDKTLENRFREFLLDNNYVLDEHNHRDQQVQVSSKSLQASDPSILSEQNYIESEEANQRFNVIETKIKELQSLVLSRKDYNFSDKQIIDSIIHELSNNKDFIYFVIQKAKDISEEISEQKTSSVKWLLDQKVSNHLGFIQGLQANVKKLEKEYADYRQGVETLKELINQMNRQQFLKIEEINKLQQSMHESFHLPIQNMYKKFADLENLFNENVNARDQQMDERKKIDEKIFSITSSVLMRFTQIQDECSNHVEDVKESLDYQVMDLKEKLDEVNQHIKQNLEQKEKSKPQKQKQKPIPTILQNLIPDYPPLVIHSLQKHGSPKITPKPTQQVPKGISREIKPDDVYQQLQTATDMFKKATSMANKLLGVKKSVYLRKDKTEYNNTSRQSHSVKPLQDSKDFSDDHLTAIDRLNNSSLGYGLKSNGSRKVSVKKPITQELIKLQIQAYNDQLLYPKQERPNTSMTRKTDNQENHYLLNNSKTAEIERHIMQKSHQITSGYVENIKTMKQTTHFVFDKLGENKIMIDNQLYDV